jgi:hypothetical protein
MNNPNYFFIFLFVNCLQVSFIFFSPEHLHCTGVIYFFSDKKNIVARHITQPTNLVKTKSSKTAIFRVGLYAGRGLVKEKG